MNLSDFFCDCISETGFKVQRKRGDDMERFEILLEKEYGALQRYVRFRIGDRFDADDVLQETCLAAYNCFSDLKDVSAFKPWLLGIARHKCDDHFRQKAKRMEIPLEDLHGRVITSGLHGRTQTDAVRETLDKLGDNDKRILYLYFFKQMPQAQIAEKLGIPVGTVKSRLYTAKANFRRAYPYTPITKGENKMKKNKMPEFLPEYSITKSEKEPFCVKWEEIMGWMIVPKLGEKLTWAAYDLPERRRTETCEMEVVGRAEVHGVEGVEITAREYEPMEPNKTRADTEKDGDVLTVDRRFIAQLTDTHCRILAESHYENGVRKCYTFLDGDEFLPNWGYGEDNCGNEVNITKKGTINFDGQNVTGVKSDFLLDIVGRFTVKIGGKEYDTVCVMDIGTYDEGILSEQFLDKNGKTVLWRIFNPDRWCFERYKKTWSEMLPDNERLTVNGKTYVHWYDCISDYIID